MLIITGNYTEGEASVIGNKIVSEMREKGFTNYMPRLRDYDLKIYSTLKNVCMFATSFRKIK